MAAIAASTAEPPLLRVSSPISEHFFESVATVRLVYVAADSSRGMKYQTRTDTTRQTVIITKTPIMILALKQKNNELLKLAAFYARRAEMSSTERSGKKLYRSENPSQSTR